MRRPAPLLAAPSARLAAYALLAAVGALQWSRYAEDASASRAIAWVLAGTLTGAGIIAAGRLPRRARMAGAAGAAAAGAVVAVLVCGLDLEVLRPRDWDVLALGLANGAQALNTVRLPYAGEDPWVLATVEVSGALLCWAAAVAATWPRRSPGPRLSALVLLLVLVAAPVVSMGATRPVWLGLALAALTAAFLWLERLTRRPGLGLGVLVVAALVVAIPLGTAADREEPWFDYKAFSETFSGGQPVAFDWDHMYGPIDWPREGAEVLRVRSRRPFYWKAEQLVEFDGRQWRTGGNPDAGGYRAVDDLPAQWQVGPDWQERLTFTLGRLRTRTVVGAGTVLDVFGTSRPVAEDAVPGRWVAAGGRELARGDSYSVVAHVPRPSPQQLAAATVGRDTRRSGMLSMDVEYRPDAYDEAPELPGYYGRPPRALTDATVTFEPFEAGSSPSAVHRVTDQPANGDAVLRASHYDRTWRLARRLRRAADTPYDYVLRVNAYLRSPRFRYTEKPPGTGGEAPLESFLFDTRLGYCQQYSGAMTLLLRMGGIPARVATGFSPGGLRRTTGEWIVRDTDAHSWVEAWFDGLGWVTFDPTPPQTPARSQVAAIDPTPSEPSSPAAPDESTGSPRTRSPEGLTRARAPAAAGTAEDGLPWTVWLGLVAATLALTTAGVLLRARRRPEDGPDAALRELERALRRSGRETPAGTTLAQLERRFGATGEGGAYLRSLRAARYGAAPVAPSRAERAAFRRELAAGLGWRGRLRALWALPPRVYPVRRPPR